MSFFPNNLPKFWLRVHFCSPLYSQSLLQCLKQAFVAEISQQMIVITESNPKCLTIGKLLHKLGIFI